MNQTILVTLIGTAGLVIGAILSFVASAFSARQKIRELELTYRQKLDENISTNARLHLDDLYIPLNAGLTKLENNYDELMATYHGTPDRPGQIMAEQVSLMDKFHQDCKEFIEQISELYNRGVDAYLSTKIDNQLRTFVWFIQQSLEKEGWILRQEDSDIAMHRYLDKKDSAAYVKKSKKKEREANLLLQLSLNLMAQDQQEMDKNGISRRAIEEKIHYIPSLPQSKAYRKQLKYGIYKLKFLIKEVTIGTVAKALLS